MNRLLSVLSAAAVLVIAAESRAQFFDDFDGNALAPHWQILDDFPGAWDYHVSGGLLTVNSLNSPSSIGSATNYQRLDAFPPPVFGDFTATVVMGMGTGHRGGQGMFMQLAGTQGAVLGWFIFSQGPTGAGVTMFAGSGSSGQVLEIDPGLHEFTMMRTGDQMSFLLDGVQLATLAHPISAQGVGWVRLGFEVEYPGGLPMAHMMVDRVSVVPAPVTGGLALSTFVFLITRRRR